MALTLTYPEGGMLVTGGTGSVGGGIVRALAKAGVPLVFTYRGNKETERPPAGRRDHRRIRAIQHGSVIG